MVFMTVHSFLSKQKVKYATTTLTRKPRSSFKIVMYEMFKTPQKYQITCKDSGLLV